ncbi:divergent polysaccharide deacetylase family protein [Acidiphilium sp. PA]|uniref:divergent polysaccharide deacetylase family protein n=1 Tax=Acidiphilium sp. PA TaxID=2871705 RepID=UPI00224421D7|nr:divergent polysaccharide deacetylase family protein [Acidiphilium sp. PA]MCW8306564.1 divergent polysaccharide deacetylase family protein [Acidiphilium sp. PA]
MPRVPTSLKLFWGCVAAVFVIGVAALQYLGPIKSVPALAARGNGIPAPSPMLQAASSVDPAWKIPHPGPYGVTPMHYYAARSTAAADQPRVAIMIAGIGYALTPSLAAVHDLPAQISLALSPYAPHDAAIAATARAAGHETIIGLPMQVDGEPTFTAGDDALRAGSAASHNLKRLDWALSRTAGYAGVTDTIGLTVPELFLKHQHAAAWLGDQLARAGVFMIVTSPNVSPPPGVVTGVADVVIDPDTGIAAETAALNRLGTIALAHGHALGVLNRPTGPAIAALAAWCKSLTAAHIALVPVSALALPAGSR